MSPHASGVAHVATPFFRTADALVPESGQFSHQRTAKHVHRVPLTALSEGDSPRLDGIDHEHVKILAEKLDELPPVLVHHSTMEVIDGLHRLNAARLMKRDVIDVVYFDGPDQEAFLLSVESNIRHGLPLSLRDRKRAALRILHSFPEWSSRAIAARVGLDHKTVGSLRRQQNDSSVQANVRVGLDGRVRPLDASEGRVRAQEVIARNPQAPLREIARLTGISVGTARDVRRRMRQAPLACEDGDGAARASVTAPDTTPWQMAIITTLESLKKDPAIRYSDDGRALVRWLESRLVGQEDAERVMRIPAHQAAKVAAIARAVAARWGEIATRLESPPS